MEKAATTQHAGAVPSAFLSIALLAYPLNLVSAKPLGATDEVIVYVAGGGPSNSVDYTARTVVTGIFGRIGVRLAWREGTSRNSAPQPGEVLVHVRFGEAIQPQVSPDALAYTSPFLRDCVPTIEILYARLQPVPAGSGREPTVLAHVLAHELGHALQGTNAHSET